ncbi:hypothetical protein SUGI_0049150 [Cryptomeria japonica]|uniref:GDSL esterase/lipase At5g33370 n=1 Tax=Cryptomeria japonica TaxID=3369 RepID=UPI002408A518|nr:GDSL esterase/lipase At5g33370 [Cryptomeria japonica]GLJ06818.1 hypothetical protein SUGI_0049150 [Cryptomeria japonica]
MGVYVGAQFVGLLFILWSCCDMHVHVHAAPSYFIFGDSLVDSGNNNYLSTDARADVYPYGIDSATHLPSGRFSNGRNIPDFICMKLGIQPILPYLDPAINNGSTLLRGANFASAGIGILNDTGIQFAEILRIYQQFDLFNEYKGRITRMIGAARANRLVSQALFSITLGGNDYVNNYYLTPVSARSLEYNLPDYTRFIVSEYKKYLRRLYTMGARKVLVTSTGPLGCVPALRAMRSTNGDCAPDLQRASGLFNPQLSDVIRQLNSEVGAQVYIFADMYSRSMGIFSNPTRYGFTDFSDACCGQGPQNGIGLCTPASNLCPNRNLYLYWDNYHPSERANSIIVDEVFSGMSPVVSPMNIRQLMNMTME